MYFALGLVYAKRSRLLHFPSKVGSSITVVVHILVQSARFVLFSSYLLGHLLLLNLSMSKAMLEHFLIYASNRHKSSMISCFSSIHLKEKLLVTLHEKNGCCKHTPVNMKGTIHQTLSHRNLDVLLEDILHFIGRPALTSDALFHFLSFCYSMVNLCNRGLLSLSMSRRFAPSNLLRLAATASSACFTAASRYDWRPRCWRSSSSIFAS